MGYKIAVIGDRDSILPFKMIGFDVFACQDGKEARVRLDDLANHQYGIIYITEHIAQYIPETIQRYQEKIIPMVILIPNEKGSLNIGKSMIQQNVEKAIGQNIL
ncbi:MULTISPECIES: V-type ATP synthase subunit F [unclassified Granulicatella]|uniref:V-type ATP synthase subunit F n=1 Tax=unclassified Granulicatella TaxID=2630493 RepID=UPI001073E0DA|nr:MULTISPECIES: V-type ATP synthase subunit F [unclassified Granulicatella]MBF0780209.1 V-type ATP synthase subunit F [Granulicatella sp. 19428wC4_WM01]TFU95702.1 V-type ATP synthase subunit F [Granulicatella sp. WM01]